MSVTFVQQGFNMEGLKMINYLFRGEQDIEMVRGLGKAIVSVWIALLRERGCSAVSFGTGSEIIAMQRLGESLGFDLVAEKIWFSNSERW